MDKHNSSPPSLTLSSAPHLDPSKDSPYRDSAGQHLLSSRSLVVLVPELELDTVNAARRVWELAHTFGYRVQFLGLCSDPAQEPSLRRQLVTMSALVADGNGSVDSKVEFGRSWLNFIKSNWREGDVIVCFAEQRTGLMKKPISKILEANLNAKVYVLSGLYQPDSSGKRWLPGAMVWAGSIGIIAGFFWLEVKIMQPPQDWAHTLLLYLSLLVEVGLIWVWNSLF